MNVEMQPAEEAVVRSVEIGGLGFRGLGFRGMAATLLRLLTNHSRFGELIQTTKGGDAFPSKLRPGGEQVSLLAAVLPSSEQDAEVFCSPFSRQAGGIRTLLLCMEVRGREW